MIRNASGQKIGAQMTTAADGTPFTGAVTVEVTIDAGTQNPGSVGAGACTHEGNGYHTYAPATAETDGALIAFTFHGTGAITVTVQVFTSYPQTGDNFTELALIPKSNGALTFNATCVGNIKSGLSTQAELDKVPKSDGVVTWNATAVAQINSVYEESAVWIDTVNGAAGTTSYVNGTKHNPCSTLASALTIATAVKLRRFILINGSSITLASGYTAWRFSSNGYAVIALGGQALANVQIEACIVSGVCTTGLVNFINCSILAVTLPANTTMEHCTLAGNITMGSAGDFYVFDSESANVGGGVVVVDFGVALGGSTFNARKYTGTLNLANMGQSGTDAATFTGEGRLEIAASCQNSTVRIAGNVILVNSGTNMTFLEGANVRSIDGTTSTTIAIETGIAALNDFDPTSDPVTLADGAHGGAASTLTLKSMAINNGDAAGVALRIQGTGAGNSHGIHVSSTNGKAIAADAAGNAVTFDSSAANGFVVNGATGDIVSDITGILQRVTLCDTTTTNTDMRGTDGAASQASVDDLPTNAEFAAALAAADDAVLAAVADLPTNAELATALGTADDAVLAQVALVKAVTDQLAVSVKTIVEGTCAAGGNLTTIIASALSPTSAVNDQFNGRIVIFTEDTTTTALRGQATAITGYSHATLTLTVTALTTAPVAGDVFAIL